MKNIFLPNGNYKRAGIAILPALKLNFKDKDITRDKKIIMIKNQYISSI